MGITMVCLFTTICQKFSCAVLTVCTVQMSTRSLTPAGRKHNEKVIRWTNIVRNLASRNAGPMILMHLSMRAKDKEHELRAKDQADSLEIESILTCLEGQAWMNRVFKERLDKLEVKLFDMGVLRREETANEPAISTFVPPNLETRRGSIPEVPKVPQVLQGSSEPVQRTDVLDRLGEAPLRRTIHPLRRL